LDNQSWAQQEFANANLGDKRRTLRLTRLADRDALIHKLVETTLKLKQHIASTKTIVSLLVRYYLVTSKLLRHA